jgi:uncharacterized protein YciI
MTTYAVQLLFDRDEDARMEVRPRHRTYLQELFTAGILLQAGPFADGDGALLIYEASDRDELDGIMAKDPYFTGGEPAASVVSVRQWDLLPFE